MNVVVVVHHLQDFVLGREVEVAGDGVLQRGGGQRVVDDTLVVVGRLAQGMQESAHEGVADAHGVHHLGNVDDRAVIHLAIGPEQAGKRVVAGADLVAHANHHLLAAGESLVQLAVPRLVGGQVHVVVGRQRLEGYLLVAGNKLILYDVAKHHVGALHHAAQRLAGLRAVVAPQVLAIVDVERNHQPHLLSHVQRLEGGVGGGLRDGGRDARHLEHRSIAQHLVPVDHARLQVIVGRAGAVVAHAGIAQGGSLLEIVDADTVAAIDDMLRAHAQLAELHGAAAAHLRGGQPSDILHSVALHGQRHGHIGLAAAIVAAEHLALRQSFLVFLGKAKHQLAECYNLVSHLFFLYVLYWISCFYMAFVVS